MFKYIARQPIFDRDNKIFAHELLYRDSEDNYFPQGITSEDATKRVLGSFLIEFNEDNMLSEKLVFVNFSKELIMSDLIFLLSSETFVIELLEDIEVDCALIDRIQVLKEKGYTFALDDYVNDPMFDPLIDYVTFIKVDLPLTTNEEQKVIRSKFEDKILLAEKVETEEEIIRLKEYGYDLFQGFYFSKPVIMKKRRS